MDFGKAKFSAKILNDDSIAQSNEQNKQKEQPANRQMGIERV